MNALAEEFHRAVGNVTQAQIDWLKAQGITGEAMVRVGLVGSHEHEIIIPVRTGIGVESPIVDLVGVNPRKPDRWRLWHGTAPILGAEAVEHAGHYDEPLVLYGAPWSWLVAGARGACVLDWRCHVSFWLAGIHRIVAEDRDLGQQLNKLTDAEVRYMEVRHAA